LAILKRKNNNNGKQLEQTIFSFRSFITVVSVIVACSFKKHEKEKRLLVSSSFLLLPLLVFFFAISLDGIYLMSSSK